MDIIPPTPQQPTTAPSTPGPTPPQPIKVAVNMEDDNLQAAPVVQESAPSPSMSQAMPPAPVAAPAVAIAPDEISQPSPATQPTQSAMPPVEPLRPMQNSAPQQPSVSPAPSMGGSMGVQAPVSGSQMPNPAAPQASNDPSQMQSPNVFDTNQYHLPIEKGKKHNAGLQMLIFVVVFVLVVVIGGVIAVDANLVDIGIKLPFDLIK